jgi:hypothetical protein
MFSGDEGTEYAWAYSESLGDSEASRTWSTYSGSSFCDVMSSSDCTIFASVNDRGNNYEITYNDTWEVYTGQTEAQYMLGLNRPIAKKFMRGGIEVTEEWHTTVF